MRMPKAENFPSIKRLDNLTIGCNQCSVTITLLKKKAHTCESVLMLTTLVTVQDARITLIYSIIAA
jgi:hypothetical protein